MNLTKAVLRASKWRWCRAQACPMWPLAWALPTSSCSVRPKRARASAACIRRLKNVYEAVVAALYLDGGTDVARDFIYRTLIPRMSEELALEPENPKSALQEKLQEDGITPTYKLVETQGPPHDRTFVAQVFAGNQGLARGTGRTKKEAESQAAKSTLARLGEFFGLGMDDTARAEKAAAAKQAKAEKAAAKAEEKARKKHEKERHKQLKQG